MACELIVFIILMTYTGSSRQQQAASAVNHQQSAAASTHQSPLTHTCTSCNTLLLAPPTPSRPHRAALNTIDMPTSHCRRRSVDDPLRCRWTDVTQQTTKSGLSHCQCHIVSHCQCHIVSYSELCSSVLMFLSRGVSLSVHCAFLH